MYIDDVLAGHHPHKIGRSFAAPNGNRPGGPNGAHAKFRLRAGERGRLCPYFSARLCDGGRCAAAHRLLACLRPSLSLTSVARRELRGRPPHSHWGGGPYDRSLGVGVPPDSPPKPVSFGFCFSGNTGGFLYILL